MIQAAPSSQLDPLERLAREHSPGVFRFLRSMVGDDDTARDLLQDTFLKLSTHAENAGKALVFTIARSCALDHFRRIRTRNHHEINTQSEFLNQHPTKSTDRPDKNMEIQSLRQDLLLTLSHLPEDQRTVFHLSEIEGLTYAEIATVLDVSPGTIASRKHHAVSKLRTALRRRGHGA